MEPDFGAVMACADGAERTILEAFLDFYRDALVRKASDLSEDDARRRLVPSDTTLAGLLKHLRLVEINWFERTLAQRPDAELPQVDWSDAAASFQLDAEDTVADLVEAYRRQCERSRDIAGRHDLDDAAPHPELGRVSLRWIYVHMIDETARHVGHADILREQIDGRTGP